MAAYESYEQENIAYWTNRAPGYSAVHQNELSSGQRDVWRRTLLQHIEAACGKESASSIRVLDVGTGPGFFAILLAERGYEVTAVDYTASMLEEARYNAGRLGRPIRFCRMNAEQLAFADGYFDVVVTRNLTWNLPHPDKAYSEWRRVLKRGGLLLNFDANWYRYLYDEEARRGYMEDREHIRRSGVADETDGTDIPAMEAIAGKAPLSGCVRPQWDLDILRRLGMDAVADEDIWKTVWTREERINNGSTPMFMIKAVKRL